MTPSGMRKLSVQKDKEEWSKLVAFANGVWPFIPFFWERKFAPELESKSKMFLILFLTERTLSWSYSYGHVTVYWQEMTSRFVMIFSEITVSVSNTLHCFFSFKGIPVYPFTSPNPRDAMAGDIIGKFLVFCYFFLPFHCFDLCHYFSLFWWCLLFHGDLCSNFTTVDIYLSESICSCQFIVLSCLYWTV